MLAAALARRLRAQARRAGRERGERCSTLAWAQVLARTSGRDDVVFGTVLFGRMQGGAGADRAMGMFINTLPVRLRLGRRRAIEAACGARTSGWRSCCGTSTPRWRWRSAAAACRRRRRCSRALLNYRHNAPQSAPTSARRTDPLEGVDVLGRQERTNYPLTLSVDDFGEALGLTAQVAQPRSTERGVRRSCSGRWSSWSQALERRAADAGAAARRAAARPSASCCWSEWNATEAAYPASVHPRAVRGAGAARRRRRSRWSYEDERADLRRAERAGQPAGAPPARRGVGPDARVALVRGARRRDGGGGCSAIAEGRRRLRAAGPELPAERLAVMLDDATPRLVLAAATLTASRACRRCGDARSWMRESCAEGATATNPGARGHCEPAPGLRDLHLRLHRPAQGRDGRASRRVEPALACTSAIRLRPRGRRAAFGTLVAFDSARLRVCGCRCCTGGTLLVVPHSACCAPLTSCAASATSTHRASTARLASARRLYRQRCRAAATRGSAVRLLMVGGERGRCGAVAARGCAAARRARLSTRTARPRATACRARSGRLIADASDGAARSAGRSRTRGSTCWMRHGRAGAARRGGRALHRRRGRGARLSRTGRS